MFSCLGLQSNPCIFEVWAAMYVVAVATFCKIKYHHNTIERKLWVDCNWPFYPKFWYHHHETRQVCCHWIDSISLEMHPLQSNTDRIIWKVITNNQSGSTMILFSWATWSRYQPYGEGIYLPLEINCTKSLSWVVSHGQYLVFDSQSLPTPFLGFQESCFPIRLFHISKLGLELSQ